MEGLPGGRAAGWEPACWRLPSSARARSLLSLAVFPHFHGFAALRVPLGDASLLCPASPTQVDCGLLRSISCVGRQPGGAQLVPESGLISSPHQTSLHLDPVAMWDVGLASVPGLEFAHEWGDLLLEALSSSWTFPGRPGHVWFSMLALGCAF